MTVLEVFTEKLQEFEIPDVKKPISMFDTFWLFYSFIKSYYTSYIKKIITKVWSSSSDSDRTYSDSDSDSEFEENQDRSDYDLEFNNIKTIEIKTTHFYKLPFSSVVKELGKDIFSKKVTEESGHITIKYNLDDDFLFSQNVLECISKLLNIDKSEKITKVLVTKYNHISNQDLQQNIINIYNKRYNQSYESVNELGNSCFYISDKKNYQDNIKRLKELERIRQEEEIRLERIRQENRIRLEKERRDRYQKIYNHKYINAGFYCKFGSRCIYKDNENFGEKGFILFWNKYDKLL